jgi:hypothetical protein
MKQLPQVRKIPAELHSRCFNCLSYSHRVATCRMPQRCLRCRGYRHIARDCKWPRQAMVMAPEAGGGGSRPPSDAPCGGSDRATWVAVGGTNGSRLRRRRRWRSKLPEEIDIVVMGNVASSSVTCCPQESDPLVLALCEGTKPPVWVDPMFDELTASLQLAAPLIVSRSVDASVLGCPSTLPAAPQRAQALLADTCSPPRMVRLSFADVEASGVDV